MVSGSKRVGRLKARNKIQSDARAAVATKAVAYIRVSTEEQAATGHGLETQDKAVRAFAESQGYDLVDVIGDPGVSGATRPSDRPGFGRILELASDGAFTVLLVYKFDRLAREIRFAVTTVSDLAEQHDVVIRSVTEPIDTATPMGRTLFAILAGMAENERFAIRDRTAGGRTTKATRGGYAGGRVPYGYALSPEGVLQIVPDQAKIVRRIFAERRRRRTQAEIAAGLNADGIPSPRGGRWHQARVGYILDNPKYRGAIEYLFRWSGTETHVLQPDAHAAIIG
ncbi:recombinase family protein [Methylorubrum rhodesianum]|uniref:recombinase family protein n=1 Tax=Methylorubrum TaxID=2282523 RepID=UPI00161F5159|nr:MULTISPECIES: recombinase family protein [Methylorubrum]MBB5765680.1 site-specific DNA recombinase [Methylorubrum rhodesianum]MBI1691548.1 recombinase family protein [Methylorubrum sp. DB1722]